MKHDIDALLAELNNEILYQMKRTLIYSFLIELQNIT